MNRLSASFAIACGAAFLATAANGETVEQLRRELAAKKAQISNLEQRLRDLQKRSPAANRPTLVATPIAVAPAAVPIVAAPPAPPDDEEMERALERTLVREGALVLLPWTYEVAPQFSYSHWDRIQDPDIRNSSSGGVSFRIGLPWQSQVSVTLPYVYNEGRDGFPSSSGLGDAGIVFSKELLLDNGWVPNLVGSVGWTSPMSRSNTFGPIPYVSGFQAGLIASKRIDPLVVFLGASYFSSASREVAGTQFNPADVIGTRIGGSLAVSPASSVTMGFNVAYLTNTHAADFIVPNSDRVLSSVDVTFSTIVWTRTLLNVTAQFGITGHVPDFRLITSLPIRF
jgi:hypothetical protein